MIPLSNSGESARPELRLSHQTSVRNDMNSARLNKRYLPRPSTYTTHRIACHFSRSAAVSQSSVLAFNVLVLVRKLAKVLREAY